MLQVNQMDSGARSRSMFAGKPPTQDLDSNSHHHHPGACLTGCAYTFRKAQQERRNKNIQERRLCKQVTNLHLSTIREKNNENASPTSSTPNTPVVFKDMEEEDYKLPSINRRMSLQPEHLSRKSHKGGHEKTRRKSLNRSDILKKLTSGKPVVIEGKYKLAASNNYENFLRMIGTGPLSLNMVMRASVFLTISKTIDECYQIKTETVIKAKSATGYRTSTPKVTQNKFREDEAKIELLEDWDQRVLLSTLTRSPDGNRLTLAQQADQNQKYNNSSTIIMEVDPEKDANMLTMTCMIDDVIAWRKFQRQDPEPNMSRRHSVA